MNRCQDEAVVVDIDIASLIDGGKSLDNSIITAFLTQEERKTGTLAARSERAAEDVRIIAVSALDEQCTIAIDALPDDLRQIVERFKEEAPAVKDTSILRTPAGDFYWELGAREGFPILILFPIEDTESGDDVA